jgi:hypothetical protein
MPDLLGLLLYFLLYCIELELVGCFQFFNVGSYLPS